MLEITKTLKKFKEGVHTVTNEKHQMMFFFLIYI